MTGAELNKRTVVIGLGNPVLGDDGVGWSVVDLLAPCLEPLAPHVELDRLAVGGLALMERLVGFDRAILVDALIEREAVPGTVTVHDLAQLGSGSAAHLDSSHDAGLLAALAAGRALGAIVPDEIVVVGIAARRSDCFDDRLSEPVAAAAPEAAAEVVRLLEGR